MQYEDVSLGEYIRRLRRERKWSLQQLASETKLSYSYLSRIENDSIVPGIEAVGSIAGALNGDFAWMVKKAQALPQEILERIEFRPAGKGQRSLNRAAHNSRPEQQTPGFAASLAWEIGLSRKDAEELSEAIVRLASMPKEQREAIVRLIHSMDMEESRDA